MAWAFESYGVSNTGMVRKVNEDSGLITDSCVAIADGLGGHSSGEVASKIAIEKVFEANANGETLKEIAKVINDEFITQTKLNSKISGMGTTLSALQIKDDSLEMLHIGDSRIYEVKKTSIKQITHDDTVIQELLEQGRLNPDEIPKHPARSILTKAILGEDTPVANFLNLKLNKNSLFLLNSDGLNARLSDLDINRLIDRDDLDKSLKNLAQAVDASGAPDNYTIILARLIQNRNDSKSSKKLQNFLGAANKGGSK